MEKIDTQARNKIKEILQKSRYSYWNSEKKEGTIVIKGNLIDKLISEQTILELVDKGILNIWSSEYENTIYSFIKNHEGMKPRYRDFGFFNPSLTTLAELRDFVTQTVEIDEKTPELYPWKFIFKLKKNKLDVYYKTKHWSEFKLNYYRYNSMRRNECKCCNARFERDELMLLDVHHKIPMRNGGSNNKSNLISICIACHALVHKILKILIDSLFIYYIETGYRGSKNIRTTLLNNDDMVTPYSQKSYLRAYDKFVSKVNPGEAKIYMFKEIESAFRYFKNKKLYEFEDYYFKCNTSNYESIDYDEWGNQVNGKISWFASGYFKIESTYDIIVHIFVIYRLSSTLSYLISKKSKETIINRNQDELTNRIDSFIHYLNEIDNTEMAVVDILTLVNYNNPLKNRFIFKTEIYQPPKNENFKSKKEKSNQYYIKALNERNKLLYLLLTELFNVDKQEFTKEFIINEKDKKIIRILKDCKDRGNISLDSQKFSDAKYKSIDLV